MLASTRTPYSVVHNIKRFVLKKLTPNCFTFCITTVLKLVKSSEANICENVSLNPYTNFKLKLREKYTIFFLEANTKV